MKRRSEQVAFESGSMLGPDGRGPALPMGEETVAVEPWQPQLRDDAIADLYTRLARYRRSEPVADDWETGVTGAWMSDVLEAWKSYDVTDFERRLNRLSHFSANVGGQQLHLVHATGQGPDPLPLLLTNGWPSSLCEYSDLLPLLTDPRVHGADPSDAFTVVVPSLPGFGFSGPPPPGGLTGRTVAGLWHRLMTDRLGHSRYVAHGSDLGAGVTAWLARDYPDSVAGIHLATPGLPAPVAHAISRAEEAYAAEVEAWTAQEGGYAHEHSTKPATLAVALLDSPAGLAAWVGEKITTWSSGTSYEPNAFPHRFLLDTLTLYWATGTIRSSLMPYWAYRHSPDAALPAGTPSPVPTAISLFGGERVPFPKVPRQLASRYFTISHWSEHDRGGHFPAIAEPHLLASILRDVFRPFRAANWEPSATEPSP